MLPLSGTTGFTESRSFSVPADSNYRVDVEIDRKYPNDDANKCLVGVGMAKLSTASEAPSNCPPEYKAPDVQWLILEDGRPLKCAQVFAPGTAGYGDAVIMSEYCAIVLRAGRSYAARVKFSGATEAWRDAAPRFVVSAEPFNVEQAAFFSIIPWGFAVLSAGAGLVLIATSRKVRD